VVAAQQTAQTDQGFIGLHPAGPGHSRCHSFDPGEDLATRFVEAHHLWSAVEAFGFEMRKQRVN
jgi:hypothetical protein